MKEKAETISEPKTCHVVHDLIGNIKSAFWVTNSTGVQPMMMPRKGYLVTRVNLHEVKLPGKSKSSVEERVRVLSKLYRVDTSSVGSLVKKKS
jgi:hypothetical protein